MKLKTCFADVLMFIVAKTKKNDTLKLSTIFINFIFFGVFKVLQCTLLGAALDNCLCFSFSKSILPTDSITIVNVRLWRGFSAV